MVAFTLAFLNVVIAYMTSETAARRGRSAKVWLSLGLIFGPFAWLAVALLPAVRHDKAAGNA